MSALFMMTTLPLVPVFVAKGYNAAMCLAIFQSRVANLGTCENVLRCSLCAKH
jgi:hypothetical protein